MSFLELTLRGVFYFPGHVINNDDRVYRDKKLFQNLTFMVPCIITQFYTE